MIHPPDDTTAPEETAIRADERRKMAEEIMELMGSAPDTATALLRLGGLLGKAAKGSE